MFKCGTTNDLFLRMSKIKILSRIKDVIEKNAMHSNLVYSYKYEYKKKECLNNNQLYCAHSNGFFRFVTIFSEMY